MAATAANDRVVQQNALLDEWLAVRAQINRAEAQASALLAQRAALMDDDVAEQPLHRDAIWRSTVAEYSAAGRIAKGSAEHAFADARWLATDDHAQLRESFTAGRVTAAHVREILTAASPIRQAIQDGTLTPETMGLYDAAAVLFAETEAPARTRTHVREIAAALAGLTINDRHERAREDRSVSVRTLSDGMALLQILLPEHLAIAIHDRLTQMARHQQQHPEDRQPTLPLDEDAIEEMLHGDPHYFDPEHDTAAHAGGPGAATDSSADEGTSRDGTDLRHGNTIFGAGDTFTRDPFDYEGGSGANTPRAHTHDWPGAPDPHLVDEDPEAYWAHVEAMIAAGPQIIHVPSDSRTLDQIRTDLLSDILLCADPSEAHGNGLSNITATIQVTIAATTLAGSDDQPAQLDGYGQLHPDTARHLAGMNGGWTRLFLDPTGMVTETDTYTPTAGMKRYLRARDQHCRFPGCRMPVHRAELDHTRDHALGGPTSVENLAHLCRTHHALKHPSIPDRHRWRARQLPNWDLQWIAPSGRTHADTPPRRVMFVPSAVVATATGSSAASSTQGSIRRRRRTWHTPTGDTPPWET